MKAKILTLALLAAFAGVAQAQVYEQAMKEAQFQMDQEQRRQDGLKNMTASERFLFNCEKLRLNDPSKWPDGTSMSYECALAIKTKEGGAVTEAYKVSTREAYAAWQFALEGVVAQHAPRGKKDEALVRKAPDYAFDSFATPRLARNVERAKLAIARIVEQNPMRVTEEDLAGGARGAQLTYYAACDKSALDSINAIRDKDTRSAAKSSYENRCGEKALAERAAKAAEAESKMVKGRGVRESDYEDTPTWFARSLSAMQQHTPALFAADGYAHVKVGVASAPAKATLLIDFASPKSRAMLQMLWPAVRSGQMELTIVPTAHYGGEYSAVTAAQLLASPKPYATLDAWLRQPAVMHNVLKLPQAEAVEISGGKRITPQPVQPGFAGVEVAAEAAAAQLEAIKQNDALIQVVGAFSVPMLLTSATTWRDLSDFETLEKRFNIEIPREFSQVQIEDLKAQSKHTKINASSLKPHNLRFENELCREEGGECWKAGGGGLVRFENNKPASQKVLW